MSNLEPVIGPLGLLNRPNEYGVIPPGAQFDCSNLFLRKLRTLSPQPTLDEWGTGSVSLLGNPALVAATDIPGSTDQRLLVLNDRGPSSAARMFWQNVAGASSGDEDWGAPLVANRPFFVKHRNRFFVLSQSAIMVHDNLLPSTTAERTPRNAGMPISDAGNANDVTATGGIYALGEQAAYRSIIRRKYADGYAIQTQPTVPIIVTSSVAAANAFYQVFFSAGSLTPGIDTIEVYRTPIRAAGIDPGPTFYLVASVPVTSAINAAGNIVVTDSTPNLGLSLELYTNPGIEGAAQDNRRPPYAKTIATYKGYTFYANLIQPPKAVLQIPVPSNGDLGTVSLRLNGVGRRITTGTSTSGNATITGISAADIVGLKIGQQYSGTNFTGTRFVTAVGATTVTLDANATASGAHSFSLYDVIGFRTVAGGSYFTQALATQRDLGASLSAAYNLIVYSDAALGGLLTTPISPTVTLTLEPLWNAGTRLEFVATNGQNYAPRLPTPSASTFPTGDIGLIFDRTPQPSAFQWSKVQQPEACPAANTKFCGSGDILKIESTRDAIFFWCSDGLYRLSGDGGDWRLDPLDSTLVPTGPRTTWVLRDNVYAYTNRGLVRVSSDLGIEQLSVTRLNELQGSPYAEEQPMLLVADDRMNEVWFSFNPQNGDRWYVYHVDTDAFVTAERTASQKITGVGYAKSGFNGGMGSVEFVGINAAASGSRLKHLSNTPTTYQAVQLANFMPAFGKSPRTVKQWQNATHFFSNDSSAQPILPRWNELSPNAATIIPTEQALYADKRATFGVPASASVAAAIKVGYATTSAVGNYDYLGFIIEFEELTTQQRAR